MLKVSKLYKYMIWIAVYFLCDFVYMFTPNLMKAYATSIRFFVGLLGVVLAIGVWMRRDRSKNQSSLFYVADRYIIFYSVLIIFALIRTVLLYDYSGQQVFFVLAPYLYVYYAYPLLYIFGHEKRKLGFLSTISKAVIIMLVIKTICWALYTFSGKMIFESLTTIYSNWNRNGTIRMDGGCLLCIAFAYYLMRVFDDKKDITSKVVILFIFLYVVFITQYRFQVIALCVTAYACFLAASPKATERRSRRILTGIVLVLFVAFGGMSALFESFSVEGTYGGSTIVRISTIAHYWEILVKQKAVLGLGLLNQGNPNCYEMMYRVNEWGINTWYYLSDIGILGGIFQFGILAIPLYLMLFMHGYRSYKFCRRVGRNELMILVVAIFTYLLFSNFALNVFDVQRAFGLPFYIAIISYCYGCCNQ